MSHRDEVRSWNVGATAQYRIAVPQGGRHSIGYWAIVSHWDLNNLLGRGETEAAAWEAAAEKGRIDCLLASVDY